MQRYLPLVPQALLSYTSPYVAFFLLLPRIASGTGQPKASADRAPIIRPGESATYMILATMKIPHVVPWNSILSLRNSIVLVQIACQLTVLSSMVLVHGRAESKSKPVKRSFVRPFTFLQSLRSMPLAAMCATISCSGGKEWQRASLCSGCTKHRPGLPL